MGRTLFYKLHRNPAIKVTDGDWERIDKLTTCFRTKFRWSCETVGFYTLDFHPRWREWFPDSRLPSDQKGWEFVNAAYEELKQKGLSRLKIIRRLHRQKLIDYDGANGLDLQSALGSTKVAGNEYNAFLVAVWLAEVSKLLPHHKFELRDEGRFLKVALMLQNGLAKPDLDYVRHTIRYIENKIRAGATKSTYENERQLLLAALEEFSACDFSEISRYCRPVVPRDFDKHPTYMTVDINLKTGNALGDIGQSMSGYGGEYWGMISETEARLRSKQGFSKIRELLKRIDL